MAGEKWIEIAGGAVLLAIAGTGLWVAISKPAANPGPNPTLTESIGGGSEPSGRVPTRAELAELQGLADAACLCGRARGAPWDTQCWSDYQQSAARFEKRGGDSTMCAEESTSTDCFGPEGANQHCVTTQRMYSACSESEERTRLAEASRRNESACSG